ncbi:MAG: magnesium and cobalt transport protein CorA [Thiobacillaceae bacterium]
MSETVECYVFRAGSPAEEITLEAVSDHLLDADAFIWIELKDPDPRLLGELGEELGLHELAVEDALTTHQRPKLEEYGDYLFISARTAHVLDNHIQPPQIQLGESHFFAGRQYVTAIRHGHALSFAKVRDRLTARRNGKRQEAPFALYSVLDLIADHYQPVVDICHDRFRSLENALLSNALDQKDLENLYTLKRELNTLRDAAEPMHSIVQDLIRLHPEFVTKELRAYYRDVYDHTVRVTGAIDMLRVSTSDAMQFHLASLNIQQNESVKKLAGWGAILAVPTVIFSLYGMNFADMPELHWTWAYPAVLAGTLAGSVWLYGHLKKRGWI